jgi:hypothetical protein
MKIKLIKKLNYVKKDYNNLNKKDFTFSEILLLNFIVN